MKPEITHNILWGRVWRNGLPYSSTIHKDRPRNHPYQSMEEGREKGLVPE